MSSRIKIGMVILVAVNVAIGITVITYMYEIFSNLK